MTKRFSEGRVVEDYIVKRLQEKGWRFVPADELQRESYQEPLLILNLVLVSNSTIAEMIAHF